MPVYTGGSKDSSTDMQSSIALGIRLAALAPPAACPFAPAPMNGASLLEGVGGNGPAGSRNGAANADLSLPVSGNVLGALEAFVRLLNERIPAMGGQHVTSDIRAGTFVSVTFPCAAADGIVPYFVAFGIDSILRRVGLLFSLGVILHLARLHGRMVSRV
jgi:hypothetical protein